MSGMGGSFSLADTVTVSSESSAVDYESAAADSLILQTTTSAFDDYFEYKLSQPITIRKNQSALVPILQTKIDAQRVSLWSPSHPVALRALWIKNTSDLTLDRGSFSIVENGNFGGEGLLDPIHPAERRLLSYAADQAVRVSTDNAKGTSHIDHISINKSILTQTSLDVSEIEYVVHNAAPEARTVVIEHAARPGWTLDSANPTSAASTSKDTKPTESTPQSTASPSKSPPARPSVSTSASATPTPSTSALPTAPTTSLPFCCATPTPAPRSSSNWSPSSPPAAPSPH